MKKRLGILTALVLVSLTVSVMAFGISSPYWKDQPLRLQPGEAKDLVLNLQNMVGSEDVALKVSLANGGDIASLTDASDVYNVPSGTSNTNVHVHVKIPDNAKDGDSYPLTFSFLTVQGDTKGTVSFGLAIERSFDVLVSVPKTESNESPAFSNNQLWLLVLVVVILGALWLWYVESKKKRR